MACKSLKLNNLEARVGIEPTHKGFADLSLTTWVPRLTYTIHSRAQDTYCLVGVYRKSEGVWSGRPGSNRRHLPWQGSTLPLSYSRPALMSIAEEAVRMQSLTKSIARPRAGAQPPAVGWQPAYSRRERYAV